MEEKDIKKTFNAFQAFRFLAFLMIFIHHTRSYNTVKYYSSAWAVSFFIMLSGWLNGYKYIEKYNKINFKDILELVSKRLKKIYPLHVITLVLSIPLSGIFLVKGIKEISKWGGKLLYNLTLVQGYINKSDIYFGFNGVSWFLCLTLFTIIMTIPMLCLVNKVKNSKNGKIKLTGISLLCIILMIIMNLIVYKYKLSAEFWLYICPIVRLPEFLLGIILGGTMPNRIKSKKVTNLLQLVSVIFIAVCIIIEKGKMFNTYTFFWSTAWIIPNMILLYAFSCDNTIISKILGNKLFVFLGNISMEMFMIHAIIIRYINYIVGKKSIYPYSVFVYLLVVTIILSYIYNRYNKK